jgi:hypothetical protein
MAGEQVAVAVERERHRGVPGSHADLLRVRPGGDPQRHRRVPKVMGTQRRQPGRPHRGSHTLTRRFDGRSTPPLSAVNTQASASPTGPRCSASSSTTDRGRVTMRRPARQRHPRSPGSRPHPHDRWSQSRQERALVSWRWLLQAGRARRKKEATYDLGHHSPADSQRLRRGRCQDRRPYAPRQAGGAIARPAMEGHGWRIPSKLGTAGPHRGHIRATDDRTAADNNGHSRPALALFTGHTPPPAAGRRDRGGLSDTEEAASAGTPCPSWATLGPRTIGDQGSATDNSGRQAPRSEPIWPDRRRPKNRPAGSPKATVRGSSPWRRTPAGTGRLQVQRQQLVRRAGPLQGHSFRAEVPVGLCQVGAPFAFRGMAGGGKAVRRGNDDRRSGGTPKVSSAHLGASRSAV